MVARRRALSAPIVAVSGPSGAGKTRLLVRLVRELRRRGLAVAVLKHTRHRHLLDRRGSDTARFRRAGAVAAAIEGPVTLAWFGPPTGSARELARRLPPVDLVLAEGFRAERLPRIEVHRRRVDRRFLCATDPSVFALVSDEPPPRPVPLFGADDAAGIAALIVARFLPAPGPGSRGSPRRRSPC